jgi:hypothetical protein
MCAVVWNDLEMEVPTFLIRHFAPHKSAEHFLDGSFHSGTRAGIIHKYPSSIVSLYRERFWNPANHVFSPFSTL